MAEASEDDWRTRLCASALSAAMRATCVSCSSRARAPACCCCAAACSQGPSIDRHAFLHVTWLSSLLL